MRSWFTLRSAVLALLALGAFMPSVAPAAAQDISPATVQEVARWGAQRQVLYAKLAQVFQILPAFTEQATRAQLRNDIRNMRGWITASRQTVAEVRAESAAAPAPPTGVPENLRAVMALNERRFPEMLEAVEQFITQFSESVDAVERGDPKGAQQAAVSSLDALILTYRLQRDINAGQGNSIRPNNPQSHLLLSLVRSYDAALAYLGLQRAITAGQPGEREAAAQAMAAAASDMRRYGESGRAAATIMSAAMKAHRPSTQDERALTERVIAAMNTFDASFARESRMADLLDAVVVLLRDNRPYEAVEKEIETVMSQFDELDAERLTDNRRRTAIIQGQ